MTAHSFLHDEALGVKCPGCGIELTVGNIGGYRSFCRACVDALPPFPVDARHGAFIEGKYPDFKWVKADE